MSINVLEDNIIGKVYVNKSGYNFLVTEFVAVVNKNSLYRVVFESGFSVNANRSQIKAGNIKDYLSPSTCNGIGTIGIMPEGTTAIGTFKREYSVWHNMMNRCYNQNSTEFVRYGAVGVTVCDRWKRFDYFLNDLPHVPGYSYNLFQQGLIYLDKDLLSDYNNRIYSPETCIFVNVQTNIILACAMPIVMVDVETGKEKEYISTSDAARDLKINSKQISNTLAGRQNTCHGYKPYYLIAKQDDFNSSVTTRES